jgi:lipoprotein-anchoring transpeptidase ErfK/SrfK
MRGRIVAVAMLAAAVGLVGCGIQGHEQPQAVERPVSASPTTAVPTTAAPRPTVQRTPFTAADAIVPEIPVYAAPGDVEPLVTLTNPTPEDVPLTLLAKAPGPPGWLQVQYNRRPNGAVGFIEASTVMLRGVENRIVVSIGAKTLTVYSGTSDQAVFQASVATGAPRTPTPTGDFYVDIVVETGRPAGVYGPYQLSVAAFSDVLQSFAGGPGQMAIHGTNQPSLIGQAVSNGCIRMSNDDVTTLTTYAPAGTPVTVVA